MDKKNDKDNSSGNPPCKRRYNKRESSGNKRRKKTTQVAELLPAAELAAAELAAAPDLEVNDVQVPVAGPSVPMLLRQIGEDHWKQGEDIMEETPQDKRVPLVVSITYKYKVDGPDRNLYYVLFPRKDAQGNWVRATGYPPDCRDWEHQLLTVEEWGEVSSVFDER